MLRTIRFAASLIVISFGALPAVAEPLKVVASFSIIGDFAKNVGGDRIELTTLVGPDGDAHVYDPKPADAAAMASADVVLVNGLHLEGFLKRLVEASATHAAVVELTKGVQPLAMDKEAHPHAEAGEAPEGKIDPHAFQSIKNAEIYVKNIADAFCAADTSGCDSYQANAGAYTDELKALDDMVRSAVASIPADKRVIITSHDAFGYFEHEYGLAFLAPEGISTEAEPSAADVAALIEQIRHDKASAIFVENITNQRLVEQIANETGLKIGGTLYSDALSYEDGPTATYVEMMRNNIRVIKGAILGS
jgi:zinc/manganese transport system substrate-binding protein